MPAQEIVYEIGGDAASLVAAGAAGAKALRQTDKAAQDMRKSLDRVTSANTAYQRSINSATGVTDGFGRSAKASAAVFQRDWNNAVKSVDRMRTTLDPLYAASKRYEAAVNSLDAAVKRGAITDAERVRLLGLAEKAYLQTGNAAVASGARLGGFAVVMERNRGTIQMLGYQVQDVAVQLAAGTRATTVFAQQGSQVLSAFGPVGAVLGALAAVTLPLLGAAFATAGSEADGFSDRMSELEGAINRLDAAVANYSAQGLEALRQKYGEIDATILGLIERERQFAIASTDRAAVDAVQALAAEYGALSINLGALGPAGLAVNNQLAAMGREMGLTLSQTRSLVKALQDAANAKDHLARAEALSRVSALLMQSTRAGDELTGKIVDAESAMRRLVAAAPQAGWLAGAISGASALAGQLWDAVSAQAALLAAQGTDDAGNPIPAGVSRDNRPRSAPAGIGGVDWGGSSGGGGGGGGGSQVQSELESLRQSLMTAEELELASYEKRQELLQQALDQRLLTQMEYASMMEDAQRAHQEAMAEIDVWRYGDGAQQAAAFMGVLADTFQSGNERMQRMGRIFGAAEALINAWRAYSQTLADPSLPFFAKFAAAASVLSAGMQAVQAIKSGGGGGRGAAATAGRGATQTASAPSPLDVRLTEFNPSGLYTGAAIGRLLEALTAEAGDRGYRLMVAR